MTAAFVERVRFAGPRGRLAGRLEAPEDRCEAAALLLGPHPLMGGRMDLPLLDALASAFVLRGVAVLRFDHGGRGDSEGTPADVAAAMADFWRTGVAPEDPVLVEEAAAADAYLRGAVPGPRHLVGYSFGAYAAALLAARTRRGDASVPAGLGLLCPTFARHAFPDLAGIAAAAVPIAIVLGDDDFASGKRDAAATPPGAAATRPGVAVVRLPGGHFLRDHEHAAAEAIASHLAAEVPA